MIWFRKKAHGLRSPHPELRDGLLCEQSLAQLADLPDYDPDTSAARFHAARASVQVGDRATARRHLHDVLALPTTSTPTRLKAWTCLRELDERPSPAAGAVVRGVAIDTGTAAGLETLVAYDDRSAVLLAADGQVHRTPGPGAGFDDAIAALLAAGALVVDRTEPHHDGRENPPEAGHACIRVLTLAGPHIGLGPVATLERDAIGGPVLRAARALRALLRQEREPAAG